MNRLFQLNIDNNRIKIDYSYNLGHESGQGQISSDGIYNFIHIPKNGSSVAKYLLSEWKMSNYYQINFKTNHLVILRDPTLRWISAVAEFLVGDYSSLGNVNIDIPIEEVDLLINTKMFQNLLFDFVIFDGHTLPQCCYIEGLDLSSITFFHYDNQVFNKIAKYIDVEYQEKQINQSLTNAKKQVIINKLKNLLSNNADLQHQIDKHYYADHQLFDQVKFYY